VEEHVAVGGDEAEPVGVLLDADRLVQDRAALSLLEAVATESQPRAICTASNIMG